MNLQREKRCQLKAEMGREKGTHRIGVNFDCASLPVSLLSEDGDVYLGRRLIVIYPAFGELLRLRRAQSTNARAIIIRDVPRWLCF